MAVLIKFNRLWSDRRGVAAIEFAIVAPVFLTLTLGALEFGRMFYVRQCLEYATEQAARYYSLNPSAAASDVTTRLKSYLVSGISASVTVSYTDTTNCNSNAYVTCTTVTVKYPFSFAESYLGFGPKTLTATSQAIRQQL
jgi:Flp pilus assembly protein TadG